MNHRHRLFTGVMFVLLGLFVLLVQFFHLGLWVLPGLGALFLLWGLGIREVGLLIPGGILLGLGAGVWLTTLPFAAQSDRLGGGTFMLAFGLGWGLITLLSAVLRQRMRWPLIPGGVLAVIGLALLAGGPALTALEWAGKLWPLLFVALGLGILWKHANASDEADPAENA